MNTTYGRMALEIECPHGQMLSTRFEGLVSGGMIETALSLVPMACASASHDEGSHHDQEPHGAGVSIVSAKRVLGDISKDFQPVVPYSRLVAPPPSSN